MAREVWDRLLAEARAMHEADEALTEFCPFPDDVTPQEVSSFPTPPHYLLLGETGFDAHTTTHRRPDIKRRPPRQRPPLEDLGGKSGPGQTTNTRLEAAQHPAVHKACHLQHSRPCQSSLWMRDMDPLPQTHLNAGTFSHAQPQIHPRHPVARQSHKPGGPRQSQVNEH